MAGKGAHANFFRYTRKLDDQGHWECAGSVSSSLYLSGAGPNALIAVKELPIAQVPKKEAEADEFNVLKQDNRFSPAFGETVAWARLSHVNLAQAIAGPYFCDEGNSKAVRYAFVAPSEGDLLQYIASLKARSAGSDPLASNPSLTEIKRSVMAQITEAVRFLHLEHGVAHRDLCPQNILIYDSGEGYPIVKLADLGHARHYKHFTKSRGTSFFAAPETNGEIKWGFAADIFSLGLVFMYILTLDENYDQRPYEFVTAKYLKGEKAEALRIPRNILAWKKEALYTSVFESLREANEDAHVVLVGAMIEPDFHERLVIDGVFTELNSAWRPSVAMATAPLTLPSFYLDVNFHFTDDLAVERALRFPTGLAPALIIDEAEPTSSKTDSNPIEALTKSKSVQVYAKEGANVDLANVSIMTPNPSDPHRILIRNLTQEGEYEIVFKVYLGWRIAFLSIPYRILSKEALTQSIEGFENFQSLQGLPSHAEATFIAEGELLSSMPVRQVSNINLASLPNKLVDLIKPYKELATRILDHYYAKTKDSQTSLALALAACRLNHIPMARIAIGFVNGADLSKRQDSNGFISLAYPLLFGNGDIYEEIMTEGAASSNEFLTRQLFFSHPQLGSLIMAALISDYYPFIERMAPLVTSVKDQNPLFSPHPALGYSLLAAIKLEAYYCASTLIKHGALRYLSSESRASIRAEIHPLSTCPFYLREQLTSSDNSPPLNQVEDVVMDAMVLEEGEAEENGNAEVYSEEFDEAEESDIDEDDMEVEEEELEEELIPKPRSRRSRQPKPTNSHKAQTPIAKIERLSDKNIKTEMGPPPAKVRKVEGSEGPVKVTSQALPSQSKPILKPNPQNFMSNPPSQPYPTMQGQFLPNFDPNAYYKQMVYFNPQQQPKPVMNMPMNPYGNMPFPPQMTNPSPSQIPPQQMAQGQNQGQFPPGLTPAQMLFYQTPQSTNYSNFVQYQMPKASGSNNNPNFNPNSNFNSYPNNNINSIAPPPISNPADPFFDPNDSSKLQPFRSKLLPAFQTQSSTHISKQKNGNQRQNFEAEGESVDEDDSQVEEAVVSGQISSRAAKMYNDGSWTAEEDAKMIEICSVMAPVDYDKVADYFPDKTADQCETRWIKVLNPMNRTKNMWTDEEDKVLRDLVTRYGPGTWAVKAENIPGRTGKQLRERWSNHLDPAIKKSDWEPWEDELIIQHRAAVGNSWTKIAEHLPGRTDNAIKNRFYSTIARKMKQGLIPVQGDPNDLGARANKPRFSGKQKRDSDEASNS